MGLFSGIPIIGGIIDGLTGQTQADAINRQTRSSTRLQQQQLDMMRQVFDEAMNAVSNARGNGVFDPNVIRQSVQRNADNLVQGIAARGLIAGAQQGDTTQAESIAQGAIQGGRALENVDFEAMTRELNALNAALPAGQSAGQAVNAMNQTGLQNLQMRLANMNQTAQNMGNLAFLGSQFFNGGGGGGGGGFFGGGNKGSNPNPSGI